MTPDEIEGWIRSESDPLDQAFDALRSIAAMADASDQVALGRDLMIRVLERRDELATLEEVISSLVARYGLYPYVREASLSTREVLLREANRPLVELPGDVVFHSEQTRIYQALMDGESVVLSAPTSFGKSLLIDAFLASANVTNAAIVVPTIALLDETRRRLARLGLFKVITHASQQIGDRNLFVMTQERLLDFPELPPIDFFVIDEFYKLDLGMDADRASLLNQILHRLLRTGAQFYMLGPGVARVTPSQRLDARLVQTDFRTVAVDVIRVIPEPSIDEALVDVVRDIDGPTLVFASSPARAREVARLLSDRLDLTPVEELAPLASWLADQYDPNWEVVRSLARGVGVHHGRLPRALAHLMVRLFNRRTLPILVCTSTLIEGVNTAAKNVIVYDNTIARRKLDLFTFNNIRGRSGRMFEHFVGRVFVFDDDPIDFLPTVDIPLLSQSEEAPPDLLIQLDSEELTDDSRTRIGEFLDNGLVSLEVLRANRGLDPAAQIAVARRLRQAGRPMAISLSWRTAYPSYQQLLAVCSHVWVLAGVAATRSSIRSDRHLAFLLSLLSQVNGDVHRAIRQQANRNEPPDESVELILEFLRNWSGHHVPRLFMALQRIAADVYAPADLPLGNYTAFVARAEQQFLPPFAAALEEYGLPTNLSLRIPGLLRTADGLDEVLERLARVDGRAPWFSPLERELLLDVQQGLGVPVRDHA